MNVIDEIGIPAMLEQCAEECSELAKACLKMSRILRGENPTPTPKEVALESIIEETSDVLICIDELMTCEFINISKVNEVAKYKTGRMERRIKEKKGEGK